MRVGIVGGGFAGLAAAIAFRQGGHTVSVFERSSGPSAAGGAISLAPNALTCLSVLGVRAHVVTEPWSQTPATVRTSDGEVLIRRTLAQLTGGDQYATVPRGQLLTWLTKSLPPDCLHYSCTVTGVHPDGGVVVGGKEQRFDLIIGADGTRGITRRSLWPDAPPPRSTGITGWAWIVDRELDAGFGPIWGRTTDFGILPLADGRTYIYGGTQDRGTELHDYRHWPTPLPTLINAADPERIATPEIFEARPPRQLTRRKVLLIGDAAHTMRPTFGQGAALAMEDAITLARCGAAGLAKRRSRMLALYAASKAGSYFATPRLHAAEKARNLALRLTPSPLFGLMAGSVSHWRPPTSTAEHDARNERL
jgi:2-polyprenyl-6-methoxyphenol hydroxylase-like FAD-dependent oxidoreductase